MVKHGVSGWLATPHDSVELAHGIAYIFEDGERRVRMGEAARRTVENSYTTPIIAQRYMALYEDVLERHRAKQA